MVIVGTTAVVTVLTYRRAARSSDHVDAQKPEPTMSIDSKTKGDIQALAYTVGSHHISSGNTVAEIALVYYRATLHCHEKGDCVHKVYH